MENLPYEVDPGKFWRGSEPQTNADFDLLIKSGIKCIISLQTGAFEAWHHRAKQEELRAGIRGIVYVNIPTSDIFAPSPERFDLILEVIDYAIKTHGCVYVHCLHGKDRTGLVCALYKTRRMGLWSISAILDMYARGFHRFPYESLGWVRALRDYLK